MKLSKIKEILRSLERIGFKLPDGTLVPSHFHVTEVGKITKDFIDCGGTLRKEEVVSFQLWNADDYDHRLHPEKLSSIIALSEKLLDIPDLDVEVEYQGNTIGKFGIDFDGTYFELTQKQTDCLAKDNCGIPEKKPTLQMASMTSGGCAPNSGCC